MIRADRALVERGLVASRSLAQRLIGDGAVRIRDAGDGRVVSRASQAIDQDDELEVRASVESRFASRAGAKLEGALIDAGIDCTGLSVLDCGMSTGGFADCLLTRGANSVIGIEVGHGQLAASLAANPSIVCFERTHIRSVDPAWLAARALDLFPMIVCDLSFISSLGLLAHLKALAAPGARLMMLVKPQFELGPDALDSRGVVRRDMDIARLRELALGSAMDAGWTAVQWLAARVVGTDGNREYFLAATAADDHDRVGVGLGVNSSG